MQTGYVLHKREIQALLWEAREKFESEQMKTPEHTFQEEVPKQDAGSTETGQVAKETVQETASSPYQTPEITEGLQNLLSEWSLFKSSGFLGMGAHGIEHPLYQKLSQLPMSNILSGRFDNSGKVVQDIRTVVNGWQREQHISPEAGETFEVYLRRVVHAILSRRADVQKAQQIV